MPLLHRCYQKQCLMLSNLFLFNLFPNIQKKTRAFLFQQSCKHKQQLTIFIANFLQNSFIYWGYIFQLRSTKILIYSQIMINYYHYFQYQSQYRKMISNSTNLAQQKGTKNQSSPRSRNNRGGVHVRKMTNYFQGNQELHQKFKQFNKQQICKSAKEVFLSMLGKHNPIAYDKKFAFMEQWQLSSSKEGSQQYKSHQAYTALSLLRMLLLGFCIWSLSTVLFFQTQNYLWADITLLILCSIESAKFIITFHHYSKYDKIIEAIQLCIAFAFCICMFVLTENQLQSFESRILGILIITQMYFRLSKIYNSLKNYHISSHQRDAINLFDLFAFLIGITHIFGCILYSTCELSLEENWIRKAGIQNEAWAVKYIYSLYFSATTLLTVGYGDLAPTNVPEIIAILVTEFIGIAIFGYTVNKIGAALSKMEQRSERVQKDLSTVQKFGKNCRLQPDVICKMRTQVINNKQLNEQLCVKDQNELLKKFSEDLREKIQIQSCTKVIKRSIFMIVNWTGSFQYKIARKLIKQVYKSEQILPQNQGKQKLYILDQGKIEVFNQSRSSSFQKVLKSISVQKQSEVAVQNIYGYSSVISSRPLNFVAVARQTSICYTLSKADFQKVLSECEEDKQHYEQIKAKIQLSKIPQQIEFPTIANIRHHYRPATIFIISKYKNRSKNNLNTREKVQRRMKKVAMTISGIEQSQILIRRNSDIALSQHKQIKETKFRKAEQSRVSLCTMDENYQFESAKSYERYFKKFNMENVVMRLKSVNFLKNLLRLKYH